MFNKKIILLISLLLITGSSYFIFHRKKDNDDEVNIVDNSDNSINNNININDNINEENQEKSINQDSEEKSNSSLKYLISFIIIIIIIIIIVIITYYCYEFLKNKKNDDLIILDIYTLKEYKKNVTYLIKIIRKYNKFQKKYKAKIDSDEIKIKELAKNIFAIAKKSFLFFKDSVNKIFIEFVRKDDDVADLTKTYRILSPGLNLVKIILCFFEMVDNEEEFSDYKFDHKNNDEKEDLIYIFLVNVIAPFFKYNAENKEKKSFTLQFGFIYPKNLHAIDLKDIESVYNEQFSEKIKNTKNFFRYTFDHTLFVSIFNLLVRKYFLFYKKDINKIHGGSNYYFNNFISLFFI